MIASASIIGFGAAATGIFETSFRNISVLEPEVGLTATSEGCGLAVERIRIIAFTGQLLFAFLFKGESIQTLGFALPHFNSLVFTAFVTVFFFIFSANSGEFR